METETEHIHMFSFSVIFQDFVMVFFSFSVYECYYNPETNYAVGFDLDLVGVEGLKNEKLAFVM